MIWFTGNFTEHQNTNNVIFVRDIYHIIVVSDGLYHYTSVSCELNTLYDLINAITVYSLDPGWSLVSSKFSA